MCNELAGHTTIIFAATCATAQRLACCCGPSASRRCRCTASSRRPKRLAALNKFKAGERSILIATDVASRGLDIPAVDLVINYELPANSKDYIHRVGRTARAGRAGRAVTLVTQYDVEIYQRIEHMLGTKLEAFPAPQEEADAAHARARARGAAPSPLHAASRGKDEKGGGKKGGRRGRGGGDDDARLMTIMGKRGGGGRGGGGRGRGRR